MSNPRIGAHGRAKPLVRRLLSAVVAVCAMAFLISSPATAVALPKPKPFVSFLDLECFRTDPYQPPATQLQLRHLNPVLATLPPETVTLGTREQLCVPVAKNGQHPPPDVAEFIKYVDLACYRIQGASPNRGLVLSQLNPLLQDVPRHDALLGAAQQLCVPVAKNDVIPPPEVLTLVSHIDLKCHAITPNFAMNRGLGLEQLNPVLVGQIPRHSVQVTNARQLCVPVQKAGDQIPPEALDIVRWVDLEKFDIGTQTLRPVTLTLRHLNPVLARLPVERATLSAATQLGVPVAKNGQIPPG
ncbi:hypothetical protein [Nonomuraea longicatena]|uniref:Secreted protein n=1 Tax=Nonomuraea longicatena TaxID=83682 RepID=A0ABP3ZT21_9ACTN